MSYRLTKHVVTMYFSIVSFINVGSIDLLYQHFYHLKSTLIIQVKIITSINNAHCPLLQITNVVFGEGGTLDYFKNR